MKNHAATTSLVLIFVSAFVTLVAGYEIYEISVGKTAVSNKNVADTLETWQMPDSVWNGRHPFYIDGCAGTVTVSVSGWRALARFIPVTPDNKLDKFGACSEETLFLPFTREFVEMVDKYHAEYHSGIIHVSSTEREKKNRQFIIRELLKEK